MLNQSLMTTAMNPSGNPMVETITSRFGDITVDMDKAVIFPRGLLGMPDKFHFVLSAFPNPKMSQFMVLQSLEDKALSFIALPADIHNGIIAAEDIRAASRDLQIEEKNLAMLFIVSVHRGLDQVKLSVNARAPLFIDSERRTGVQYVFQQDRYNVQHML